jgi:hypothetical protein
MKGWVYIITTKAIPNLIKVGFSTKDPELRALELNNTGNPYPYKVEYDVLVNEPRAVEQTAHELLKNHHENKEWYKCSIEIAIAAIRKAAGTIFLENCPIEISPNITKEENNQQFSRFIIQNGIATETQTGLTWLRFAHGQAWQNGTAVGKAKLVTWQAAFDIAENLNKQGGYGDYNDWRLPTISELITLSDENNHRNRIKNKDGYHCNINTDVFPIVVVDGNTFWSTSSCYRNPLANISQFSGDFVKVANFMSCFSGDYKTRGSLSRFKRPVRAVLVVRGNMQCDSTAKGEDKDKN